MKLTMKNFPAKKTRDSDDFTGEFSQTFMEEVVPVLSKNLFEDIIGKNTFQLIFSRYQNQPYYKKTMDLINIDAKNPE